MSRRTRTCSDSSTVAHRSPFIMPGIPGRALPRPMMGSRLRAVKYGSSARACERERCGNYNAQALPRGPCRQPQNVREGARPGRRSTAPSRCSPPRARQGRPAQSHLATRPSPSPTPSRLGDKGPFVAQCRQRLVQPQRDVLLVHRSRKPIDDGDEIQEAIPKRGRRLARCARPGGDRPDLCTGGLGDVARVSQGPPRRARSRT